MKWLLTFLAGLLIGAGGLFAYLRQMPQAAAPPAAAAGARVDNAADTAADTAADAARPYPLASLPMPQFAPVDLGELVLPLHPAPAQSSGAAPSPAPSPAPAVKLLLPVEGVSYSQLSDNFDQPRGAERHHEALDIMAPKGSKVVAVADGTVAKLFNSKPGGLTLYQFDPSATYAYYYAHLDRYADGIEEGRLLKRGELIGYVGSSGNAAAVSPHLHFAVIALTPDKQWWKGVPLNPYPMLGDEVPQQNTGRDSPRAPIPPHQKNP